MNDTLSFNYYATPDSGLLAYYRFDEIQRNLRTMLKKSLQEMLKIEATLGFVFQEAGIIARKVFSNTGIIIFFQLLEKSCVLFVGIVNFTTGTVFLCYFDVKTKSEKNPARQSG